MDTFSDEERAKILADLKADLRVATKARDKKRILDTILRMEAADVNRARLILDAEKQGESDAVGADEILAALEEAKKRRGGG